MAYCASHDATQISKGYHGRGFTDTWTQIGASATLQIESSRETDYTLQIRYANAQRDEKTLSLYVNGHKLQQVIFPVVAMSDWNTWGTVSYRVPLVCGSNSVMLKYDSGDSGNINIDALTLVPKKCFMAASRKRGSFWRRSNQLQS